MENLTNQQKSKLCLKCQYCCTILAFPIHKREYDFYLARGIEIKINQDGSYVIIPHKCQYLSDTGCTIYSLRQIECKLFDGSIDFTTKDKCLWRKEQQ